MPARRPSTRYDDSSDDEEETPRGPLMGIVHNFRELLRRPDADDSDDDSDDDQPPPPPPHAPAPVPKSIDDVYRRFATDPSLAAKRTLRADGPTAPGPFGLHKYLGIAQGDGSFFEGYAHVMDTTPLLIRYTVAIEITDRNLAEFLRVSGGLKPRSLLQAQIGVMTGPLTGGIASLITTRMSVVPIILNDDDDPLVFPASLAGATKFAMLDMAGRPLVRRVGGALSGVYTASELPASILEAFVQGVKERGSTTL